MKKANIVYAVAIIALGVFAGVYAMRYHSTDPFLKVGADTFPMIMGGGLVLTGLVILVGALRNRVIPGEERASETRLGKVLLFAVAFAAYFSLLRPLGFIVDGAIMVAFCMRRLGCANWPAIVAYSLIMPFVVFVVFYYFMYVDLPLGVLEPILPKY